LLAGPLFLIIIYNNNQFNEVRLNYEQNNLADVIMRISGLLSVWVYLLIYVIAMLAHFFWLISTDKDLSELKQDIVFIGSGIVLFLLSFFAF
jgi:type II secretory pathway component PulF